MDKDYFVKQLMAFAEKYDVNVNEELVCETAAIRKIIKENVAFKEIWICLLESAMRYKIYRENGFLVENATERYIHFKKIYPDLSKRVPQRHIATYLGIAPESLSRIRSAMKEE